MSFAFKPLIKSLLTSNSSQLGLHDDALVDVEESISLNDFSFKVYRTRARIYLHMEKYDAAIADFKTAMEQAESEGSDADVKALKSDLKKAELDLKRSKTKDYYKILGSCSLFVSGHHGYSILTCLFHKVSREIAPRWRSRKPTEKSR